MRQFTYLSLALSAVLLAGCGSSDPDNSPAADASMSDTSAPEPMPAADMAAVDLMTEFGTTANNVFFYYEDVEAATTFYREVLGLRVAADYGFAKIMQVAPKSFITLVDASEGMHSADEPKTTANALVTDQLDEWWDYLQTQEIDWR